MKTILNEIEGKFVHKKNKLNIAISEVTKDEIKNNIFHTYLIINKENNFFFENERKHIPGILLIEATRQNCMAIAHKYYNISFDKAFLINGFDGEFHSFANIDDPITIKTIVEKKNSKFLSKTIFYQNKIKLATFKSSFTTLSHRLVSKLEVKLNA